MCRYLVLMIGFFSFCKVYAASVYFIKPKDGQHIKGSQLEVVFGLKDRGIAPAGVDKPKTGHHHLLLDYEGELNMSKPLPSGNNLIHFGGGQTETVLKDLKKGKHILRLVLGDFSHTPHKPPIMSPEITFFVD